MVAENRPPFGFLYEIVYYFEGKPQKVKFSGVVMCRKVVTAVMVMV